jgi:hypothetical protein
LQHQLASLLLVEVGFCCAFCCALLTGAWSAGEEEEEEAGYEEGAGEEEEGYEEEEGGEEEEGYEEEEGGGEEEEGYEEEGGEEEGGGGEEEEGGDAGMESAAAIASAVASSSAGSAEKAVYARCMYDFAAEKDGDLSLRKGAIVTMSAKQDFAGAWLYGAIDDSPPGYFPASFVKLISESEALGTATSLSSTPASSELTDSQLEDKAPAPAQSGWRLERDQLKTRLAQQEQEEAALRAEVAELERSKGELLKQIATLKYGSGRGKGGIVYDLEKLNQGTYFETDALGRAVDSSTELCKLLKEFAALIEKGFEKEKDVAVELDAALKSITAVVNLSQAELAAISVLSNTKDKYSAVVKQFASKVSAEKE